MTKLLTLEEWSEKTYESKQPSIKTLRRWARSGNIYPAPEKHGREYRVKPNAIYIQPKSFNLARALQKTGVIEVPPLIERIINGEKTRKVRR
ncbi:excisionase [Serratia marcescens]|jgi:predicted site-specific integrase-resolvase|uniref:excisionase n=1 Tax=Serratia TaxID=613 RepID=UPI0013DCC110|nr:excisionase [Serratia marcescens]MDU7468616.1 excisionase [Serratia marcescens]MDX6800630.1 excisionase [Serratia marcescens]MDX6905089.1 excisionase [Serratia marcescens]WAZ00956.1 excisionase [Serratia marcescens]HEJ7090183.1 excisionase [Serratia marcescens]